MEPLNNVHREGDWIVVVENNWATDTLDIKIGQRNGNYTTMFLPDGVRSDIMRGERFPDEPTFKIDRDVRIALAHALLAQEPLEAQLLATLKATVERAESRVDKLIDHVINAPVS